MATSSTAESSSETDAIAPSDVNSAIRSDADAEASASDTGSSDASSLTDKLDTAATVLRAVFLAFVLVLTLIPVVGLLAGSPPFPAPDPAAYYALVGFALVGTIALVAAELWGG
ncbi:hypothetical protein [Halorussus caseinilyticus]|uniref:Cox cluster protein n=1 Tax=Halorussus caseinilyticus TaxID=3034025 RepID=A0ABD5WKM1_9EURY|nr:hypothetical protein [Halorussus sp. DT72]